VEKEAFLFIVAHERMAADVPVIVIRGTHEQYDIGCIRRIHEGVLLEDIALDGGGQSLEVAAAILIDCIVRRTQH
jgi:tRNA G37 N-methylase TrmD